MEATLDELEKLCGTTAAGTTMDGLVRAAAKKGLQPNARKANLAFLKQQAGPVIIDCPRGHYCVLIGWKDGRALVYDPPSPARWVSEAELQVNWTGHVLWFARKP